MKEGGWLQNQPYYHNSHELFYRNPFGAIPCGTEVTLRLRVLEPSPDRVALQVRWEQVLGTTDRITPYAEMPMFPEEDNQDGSQVFQGSFTVPDTPGLIWYTFTIAREGQLFYYGNNAQSRGGPGQTREDIPPPYQLTVYKPATVTPGWFKETVVYQVFVDRFFNGSLDGRVLNPKKGCLLHAHWDNDPVYIREADTGRISRWDFFGGNLAGVLEKLPYLKKLGIGALYFNPLFESPSNHKYDVSDYHTIDAMFGDNGLFSELCATAGALGIAVILDGVFSHTGSDSIYFNREGNYKTKGAYQSPQSPYFPWYRFHEYPDQYESWWGIETMPNVNELEPSYLDFMIHGEDSVLRHWLKAGIKGWRLDVADELPAAFIKQFRHVLKEVAPEAILIGEVWEDASNTQFF